MKMPVTMSPLSINHMLVRHPLYPFISIPQSQPLLPRISSYNFASLLPSNPTHILYPLKHSGFATVLLTPDFPSANNPLHRRLDLLPIKRQRNFINFDNKPRHMSRTQ